MLGQRIDLLLQVFLELGGFVFVGRRTASQHFGGDDVGRPDPIAVEDPLVDDAGKRTEAFVLVEGGAAPRR